MDNYIKDLIREVPDWPKEGVNFLDITPVLNNPAAFEQLVSSMEFCMDGTFDHIVALDARGFIFGSVISIDTCTPLVMARKKGKLPPPTDDFDCTLEYGTASYSLPHGVFTPGERVLIVDDLLATGGTAKCVVDFLSSIGVTDVQVITAIDLTFLHGDLPFKHSSVFQY